MITTGTQLRMANKTAAIVEDIVLRFHETIRKADGTSEDRQIPYAYLRIVGPVPLQSLYPVPVHCIEEGITEGRYSIVE